MGDEFSLLAFMATAEQEIKRAEAREADEAAAKAALETQGKPGEANTASPKGPSAEVCLDHPELSDTKNSLSSTEKGVSVLNRLFEIPTKSGDGKLSQTEFAKKLGPSEADQLKQLGVLEITNNDQTSTLSLKKRVEIVDGDTKVAIGKKDNNSVKVSFTAKLDNGLLKLDNVQGIKVSDKRGAAEVTGIDLQPRQDGYMSGVLHTFWLDVNVCALPNGKFAL